MIRERKKSARLTSSAPDRRKSSLDAALQRRIIFYAINKENRREKGTQKGERGRVEEQDWIIREQ